MWQSAETIFFVRLEREALQLVTGTWSLKNDSLYETIVIYGLGEKARLCEGPGLNPAPIQTIQGTKPLAVCCIRARQQRWDVKFPRCRGEGDNGCEFKAWSLMVRGEYMQKR